MVSVGRFFLFSSNIFEKTMQKYKSKVKIERMKARSEFVALNTAGISIFRRGFIFVHSSEFVEGASVRVGFTASKKVGNAVQRARAKRRLRSLADDLMRLNPQFHSKGCAITLIARKFIFDCDYEKMKKDLSTALEEMGATI